MKSRMHLIASALPALVLGAAIASPADDSRSNAATAPNIALYREHCIGRWDFDDPSDLLRATFGEPLVAGGQQNGVSVPQSGVGAVSALADVPENTLEGVPLGGVAVVPRYAHLIPTDTFTPEVAAGDFTYRMVVYLPSGRAESSYWCMFWSGENRDGVGYAKTDGTFGGGTLQDSGDPKYVSVPGILDNWHEFRFVYTQQGRRLTVLMDGSEIRSAGDISTANLVRIFGDNDGEDNAVYIASLELFDTADADEVPPYLTASELGIRNVQSDLKRYDEHCLGKWDFDKADDLLLATYGQDLVAGGSGTVSALADPPENTLGGTELGGVARIPRWAHLTVSDTLTGDVMEGDFTFRILAYLDTTLGESSYHSFFWDGENDGTVFVYDPNSSIGGPYYGGSSNYTKVPGIANAWHDFRFAYHADTGKMDFYMDGVRYKTASLDPARLPHLFGDNDGEDNTAYVAAIELFDTADQRRLPNYLTSQTLRCLKQTVFLVF